MSKFTPYELARMHGYKEICDDAVKTIGELYKNATSGEDFNYNTSSDNMIGRGVPEDMMFEVEAAVKINKAQETEKIIEAPEATKKGDEIVAERLNDYGVTVEKPEVEERMSEFFPGVLSEVVDDKSKMSYNVSEKVNEEEQEEPANQEENEVIEPQVSNEGSYQDIVNSAVKQEEPVEETAVVEEPVMEEPAKEEPVEEAKEPAQDWEEIRERQEEVVQNENVFNPIEEIEKLQKEMEAEKAKGNAKEPAEIGNAEEDGEMER